METITINNVVYIVRELPEHIQQVVALYAEASKRCNEHQIELMLMQRARQDASSEIITLVNQHELEKKATETEKEAP